MVASCPNSRLLMSLLLCMLVLALGKNVTLDILWPHMSLFTCINCLWYSALNKAKGVSSNSWRMCVQCGGKQHTSTFLDFIYSMKPKLKKDAIYACPGETGLCCFLLRFSSLLKIGQNALQIPEIVFLLYILLQILVPCILSALLPAIQA